MASKDNTIISTPDWPAASVEDRLSTSDLIYQSFEEFYDLFSDSKETILNAISSQLLEPNSEVSNTKIIKADNNILGAYSYYPTEEMGARQGISLRIMLESCNSGSEVFVRLKNFRTGVAKIDEPGLYLARIAISKEYRGQGIGQILIGDLESSAVKSGFGNSSLHVKNDNETALRFYNAAGYNVISDKALMYYSMLKKLK